MFCLYDPKFVPIARATFMKELEIMFNHMIAGIVKLVNENRQQFTGLQWLSICHDMWCTTVMDDVLGSSL